MKVPFAISPLYQCPLAMRRQSRARHVRRRWSLSEAVEINVWNKELRNMSPVFVSCFVSLNDCYIPHSERGKWSGSRKPISSCPWPFPLYTSRLSNGRTVRHKS